MIFVLCFLFVIMVKVFFIFVVFFLVVVVIIDVGVFLVLVLVFKFGVVLFKVLVMKFVFVKVFILNKSFKDFVIKVKELGFKVKVIVVKVDKWIGVGEFKVSLILNYILYLIVSVKNEKNMLVMKEFVLNLFNRVKCDLEGKKFVVLKVVEDRKKFVNGKVKKFLSIWLDVKIVFSINLFV